MRLPINVSLQLFVFMFCTITFLYYNLQNMDYVTADDPEQSFQSCSYMIVELVAHAWLLIFVINFVCDIWLFF